MTPIQKISRILKQNVIYIVFASFFSCIYYSNYINEQKNNICIKSGKKNTEYGINELILYIEKCDSDVQTVYVDRTDKNLTTLFVLAFLNRTPEFDFYSCKKLISCTLDNLFEENFFIEKFKKLFKNEVKIYFTSFLNQNAVKLTVIGKKILLSRAKIGQFSKLNDVIRRYFGSNKTSVDFSEERIKLIGSCVPQRRISCQREYVNSPTQEPNLLKIWNSIKQYYLNNDVSIHVNYVHKTVFITIKSRDDFVYNPSENIYNEITQKIRDYACSQSMSTFVYFLPPPLWKAHLGLEVFQNSDDCLPNIKTQPLRLIYPVDWLYQRRI